MYFNLQLPKPGLMKVILDRDDTTMPAKQRHILLKKQL